MDELCSTSGSDESQQSAADLVQRMKDAGLLTAFGAGRQVPKRLYTLEDLRLNKVRCCREGVHLNFRMNCWSRHAAGAASVLG